MCDMQSSDRFTPSQTTVLSLTQDLVDVDDVLASANLARITRARFVTLTAWLHRKPLGVVREVRVARDAAPAVVGGLESEVGGTGAVLVAALRGEDSTAVARQDYMEDQERSKDGQERARRAASIHARK